MGVIAGIIAGLIPGVHQNTVISVVASLGFTKEQMAYMILGLLPVNIIIAFIPAIFFGIPEQQTVLTALPGHRMVLEGNGLYALKVVLTAALFSVLVSIGLFAFSLPFFEIAYSTIQPHIKWVVIAFSFLFIVRTKNPLLSLLTFSVSGLLGYYSLNTKMTDPFLPLFVGLFAMAAIISYNKSGIPRQNEGDRAIDLDVGKYVAIGTVAGMCADILPGISSPSQVATFLTIFLPLNTLGYLATITSISMSETIFSFATAASINKSRMGATEALDKVFPIADNLLVIITLFLAGIVIATAIVYALRKHIAKLAQIDFSKFNIVLALYLIAIIFVLDGVIGLIIFILASALGYLTIRMNVERTTLMGAVIVPTLMLLFRIFI